jgi:hypothetical protein
MKCVFSFVLYRKSFWYPLDSELLPSDIAICAVPCLSDLLLHFLTAETFHFVCLEYAKLRQIFEIEASSIL